MPYLDVLVLGQTRGDAGQDVVVEVQLSQVGDVRQCAVFHSADLIVAQTQSARTIRQQVDEILRCAGVQKYKRLNRTNCMSGETDVVKSAFGKITVSKMVKKKKEQQGD